MTGVSVVVSHSCVIAIIATCDVLTESVGDGSWSGAAEVVDQNIDSITSTTQERLRKIDSVVRRIGS